MVEETPRISDLNKRNMPAEVCLIFGCCASALLSNTVSAFNFIQQRFQNDMGASNEFTAVMMGVGTAFIQLVLIQGRLLDHYGPIFTTVFCGIFGVLGYALMSITYNPGLMFLEYLLVSFGSGGTFLAALSSVIALQNTLGIALVSLCMSVSLSLTVAIAQIYQKRANCNDDYCWRPIVQVYAISLGIAFTIVTICMAIFRRCNQTTASAGLDRDSRLLSHASINNGPPRGSISVSSDFDESENRRSHIVSSATRGVAEDLDHPLLDDSQATSASFFGEAGINGPPRTASAPRPKQLKVPSSFRDSLTVLKTKFWWILFIANMLGISTGIFLISNAFQIFNEYVGDDDSADDWSNWILPLFSYWNGFSNVVSPILADILLKKKILSRKTFIGWVLLIVAVNFGILIILHYLPNHGQTGSKLVQVIFLALVATAFGTLVVLVPQIIGATYPPINFGVYVSYMQVGSASWGAVTPILATAVKKGLGSYVYVYFFYLVTCTIVGFALFRVSSPVAPLDSSVNSPSKSSNRKIEPKDGGIVSANSKDGTAYLRLPDSDTLENP